MKVEWFRKQWNKVDKKATPFQKGKLFSGGDKFPLIRGKMADDLWAIKTAAKASDYFYSVKD